MPRPPMVAVIGKKNSGKTTVTVRLVTVSAPGLGRAARNYTAVSDLSFVGTPAS